MARAAGTAADAPGARGSIPRSVPILIHGDAAPWQGSWPRQPEPAAGHSTGGTIHIIANNQLGFYTGYEDAYSTSYASGLARGFKIPIVHVNADDPEACVEAARLAIAYRAKFQRDFLIDLIGYRRHGQRRRRGLVHPAAHVRGDRSHPTARESGPTRRAATRPATRSKR